MRKKRQIQRQIAALPSRSVVLAEDETDLLLFPPLRSAWALRGQPTRVWLSGRNARRVVFGTLNLWTGKRLFLVRHRQRAADFQAFLQLIHHHYRGWHVVLVLDEDPSHTAQRSLALAAQYGIHWLWLPKRAPELNPLDTLWGHAKNLICANQQSATLDDQVERFVSYLNGLSNREALNTAGVYSPHFWLQNALCNYFCGPA